MTRESSFADVSHVGAHRDVIWTSMHDRDSTITASKRPRSAPAKLADYVRHRTAPRRCTMEATLERTEGQVYTKTVQLDNANLDLRDNIGELTTLRKAVTELKEKVRGLKNQMSVYRGNVERLKGGTCLIPEHDKLISSNRHLKDELIET